MASEAVKEPVVVAKAEDDEKLTLTDASDADLIDLLEVWFCRGSVTTAFGDAIVEASQREGFFPAKAKQKKATNVDDVVELCATQTDDPSALVRYAAFQEYTNFTDEALDNFVENALQLFEGESSDKDSTAGEVLIKRVAAAVLEAVTSSEWQHLTCVPYVAAALEFPFFVRLVAETASMAAYKIEEDDGEEEEDDENKKD